MVTWIKAFLLAFFFVVCLVFGMTGLLILANKFPLVFAGIIFGAFVCIIIWGLTYSFKEWLDRRE